MTMSENSIKTKTKTLQESLYGPTVTLTPTQIEHAIGLFDAANNEEIWSLLPHDPFKSIREVEEWIVSAMEAKDEMPFSIFNSKKEIIGSTRYLDIQKKNLALEIGWTWLNPTYWGTKVNIECKFILLQHAFERMRFNRVQFKTDLRNIRSQKAIEKLGAKKEGILRSNMLLPDGFRRDSIYYSILIEEWFDCVKTKLEMKLKACENLELIT